MEIARSGCGGFLLAWNCICHIEFAGCIAKPAKNKKIRFLHITELEKQTKKNEGKI